MFKRAALLAIGGVCGGLYPAAPLLACDFPEVQFNADFPGARLSECQAASAHHYRLQVRPEDEPVNPSPWYAFSVQANQNMTIRLQLDFARTQARYRPKISRAGGPWESLPHRFSGGDLWFEVEVGPQTARIAAQEIIDNTDHMLWLSQQACASGMSLQTLGHSTQRRPLHALISDAADEESAEWLVLIGRQHPPEVPGALALRAFSETLLADDPLSRSFRARFKLMVVPNMNPDGVALGHWRHNAAGVDLNRDWKNFSQPETRAVRDWLAALKRRGGRPVFALDFHATQQDIFYTMPEDYGLQPAGLVRNWLHALGQALPDYTVQIKPGNNPDRGVFKQFMADQYGVHAVTYEMGDETERARIAAVAESAARALMRSLLDTPPEAFD